MCGCQPTPCRAMGWEASLPVRIHLHPRCRATRTRTRRETRSPSPSTPSVAVASPRHQGSTSRASSAFIHQSRRPSTRPERWCIPPPHGARSPEPPQRGERSLPCATRHASGARLRERRRASRAAPAICVSVPPLCLRALTGAKGRALQQRVGAGGRVASVCREPHLCALRDCMKALDEGALQCTLLVAGHPPSLTCEASGLPRAAAARCTPPHSGDD